MRRAFAALAALLMLVVVAEFFFAASGAFNGGPGNEAYRPHHVLGYVIFLLPVLMAIVAGLARLPGRLSWLTLAVSGLTGVQVVIAKLSIALDGGAAAALFGLHAVNGLFMLAVVATVVRQGWRLSRPAAAEEVAPAAPVHAAA